MSSLAATAVSLIGIIGLSRVGEHDRPNRADVSALF